MIYIALPILNEFDILDKLIESFKNQTFNNFVVVACVNNYESWYDDDSKKEMCSNNADSIKLLRNTKDIDIVIIDKSSKSNAWKGKKGGVGFARKVAMDYISEKANYDDIILSCDADTYYPENYLEEVKNFFKTNHNYHALSIPYYHESKENQRLILRYELYMRYYFINMLRIGNPYAFTAIGSAMACRVSEYRRIGGITPVKSGEDFYFLQKLAKNGVVANYCNTVAYPSSRFSSRVDFGTGPALLKGAKKDWDSYPIYGEQLFDNVKQTFDSFNDLYINDISFPMEEFLKMTFKTNDLWSALRNNYKDLNNFVRACMVKVDALRILQYLKFEHKQLENTSDSANFADYMMRHFYDDMDSELKLILKNFDFFTTSTDNLEKLRKFLFGIEQKERKLFNAGLLSIR